VQPSVFEQRLVSGGADGRDRRQERRSGAVGSSNGADARGKPLSGREDTERAFLALCIASPQEGETALASLDIDEHFSSELLRRAARHLRAANLRQPMAPAEDERGLEDDPELQALLAELVVEAGRDSAHPAMLEVQRLQLELARVERQIQQARGKQSGEVSELAQRKATVKREFDRAYGRVLEVTGEREG
jgi:DNA primase